ncbi:M23 family metallopeptidase, partial [Nocardia tengchongensis]|uniref:M23 family metallopeptidase n=1 Tax=Nocardia tengchongensis TaxID=2055889 RepID=UPI0036A01E73
MPSNRSDPGPSQSLSLVPTSRRRGAVGLCVTVAFCLSATVLATPGSAAPTSDFGWPLTPLPAVVRVFDKPDHDWLPGHRGVDLAGSGGQAVLAAGEGFVAFAGTVAGKPVVSIDHAGGLRTTYEPVTASITVGRRLSRGTAIGVLETGHTPCSPCLHWGARRDGEYLDPLGLLHRAPIRLKPLANGEDVNTARLGIAGSGTRIGRRRPNRIGTRVMMGPC